MILLWPTVTLVGFIVMAGLVIALGRGSTARYEYERNRVEGRQQPVPTAAAVAAPAGDAPAGSPTPPASGQSGPEGDASAPGLMLLDRTAVGAAATHPAGKRIRESTAATAGWWLLDESGDEPVARVLAGPFAERLDADWAGLALGPTSVTRPVFGVRRADGSVARRQSPGERAWLAQLGGYLARLPEDWDEHLSDDDPLSTLVVEVGAALMEAGLPLHEDAASGPDGDAPTGGVCLTPDIGGAGILVTWRQHDRMSRHQVRGAAAQAAVQRTMATAVARVLEQLGFQVESLGSGSCYRVTAPTAQPA